MVDSKGFIGFQRKLLELNAPSLKLYFCNALVDSFLNPFKKSDSYFILEIIYSS
jgi:hypothetical protein